MKVKFSNAEVDIWKMRKGAVIAYESSGLNYGHLHTFCQIHGPNPFMEVTIDEWGNLSRFNSNDLIWMEPAN